MFACSVRTSLSRNPTYMFFFVCSVFSKTRHTFGVSSTFCKKRVNCTQFQVSPICQNKLQKCASRQNLNFHQHPRTRVCTSRELQPCLAPFDTKHCTCKIQKSSGAACTHLTLKKKTDLVRACVRHGIRQKPQTQRKLRSITSWLVTH